MPDQAWRLSVREQFPFDGVVYQRGDEITDPGVAAAILASEYEGHVTKHAPHAKPTPEGERA